MVACFVINGGMVSQRSVDGGFLRYLGDPLVGKNVA
jgi:hypothetical protein